MKKTIVAFLSIMLVHSVAFASEADKVSLPKIFKVEGAELILNGSGLRTKKVGFMTFDLYVAGLYLTQKGSDVEAIAKKDEPMAIKLHIISKMITGKRMSKATRGGFEKSTGGNVAPIQAEVDRMISVFKDKIKIGDVYDLVYIPQKGVLIYKNKELKETVKTLAFKKAMFGVWLGAEPIQKDLKKKLAGS